MAYTNTDRWVTVDGVRLDTYAHNIETKSGRFSLGGKRGENAVVAGRHGALWTPSKKFDVDRYVMSMWANGCDADGGIPSGSSAFAEFRKNLDKLGALFTKSSGLLDVREIAGSTTRQAYAECVAAIDPAVFGINPAAKFTVELVIPGVFWQDLTDSDFDSLTGVTTSFAVNAAAFAGATAPMEDLYIVIDGPANLPKLIDNATGHYVQLNENLAAGNQWVVNTSLWTSKVGAGIAFTQSGTDKTAVTLFSGPHNPRYFAMSPVSTSQATGPQLTFTNTGGSSAATRVRVRGRRKYL